jgi:hypothetical protein
MNSPISHQRFIRDWYKAALQGRQVNFRVPKTGDAEKLRARMREIQSMNPHLFPQKV